jgi:hypothetical protein
MWGRPLGSRRTRRGPEGIGFSRRREARPNGRTDEDASEGRTSRGPRAPRPPGGGLRPPGREGLVALLALMSLAIGRVTPGGGPAGGGRGAAARLRPCSSSFLPGAAGRGSWAWRDGSRWSELLPRRPARRRGGRVRRDPARRDDRGEAEEAPLAAVLRIGRLRAAPDPAGPSDRDRDRTTFPLHLSIRSTLPRRPENPPGGSASSGPGRPPGGAGAPPPPRPGAAPPPLGRPSRAAPPRAPRAKDSALLRRDVTKRPLPCTLGPSGLSPLRPAGGGPGSIAPGGPPTPLRNPGAPRGPLRAAPIVRLRRTRGVAGIRAGFRAGSAAGTIRGPAPAAGGGRTGREWSVVVKEISLEELEERVRGSALPAVVDIWIRTAPPAWPCCPLRRAGGGDGGPDPLPEDEPGGEPAGHVRLGLRWVPTLIFYRAGGTEVRRLSGTRRRRPAPWRRAPGAARPGVLRDDPARPGARDGRPRAREDRTDGGRRGRRPILRGGSRPRKVRASSPAGVPLGAARTRDPSRRIGPSCEEVGDG